MSQDDSHAEFATPSDLVQTGNEIASACPKHRPDGLFFMQHRAVPHREDADLLMYGCHNPCVRIG